MSAFVLVVPELLALVALGSAVVGPGPFEPAAVVEHADASIRDGDIAWDGNDDSATFAGFERFGAVHPLEGLRQ